MGFIDHAKERSIKVSNAAMQEAPSQVNVPVGPTPANNAEKQQTPPLSQVSPGHPERVTTVYDKIIEFLEASGGKAKLIDIVKALGENNQRIRSLLEIFEEKNIVDIIYPLNMFSDITVVLKIKKVEKRLLKLPTEKQLTDSYSVTVDSVTARVNIWISPYEDVPIYEILLPDIGTGTQILVEHAIGNLAQRFMEEIEKTDVNDSKKSEEVKQKLFAIIKEEMKKEIPKIAERDAEILSGVILHEMYGLGRMELMMGDNWLEEIAINGSDVPVSVYHKRFGWAKSTMFMKDEEEIYNFASQVGRRVGRQINSLNPMMDANLDTGDRIAATLAPISTSGNTLTIRRFSRNPWTIIHLVDPSIGTMSIEIAAFLWLCVQYELNIMIAGGTASGKTSVLNSVCSLIPATQRILSIEDTRELALPNDLHWNWVPLSSRSPNPEGQGGVTMLDLMVESLRMRPDRIIVGEIRRREQAETLFETMHTGHSVYATMHADTVEQVERRLIEPPIEIPKTEIGALQLIVVQYRDRRLGARRTLEVAEILSQETDGNNLSLNYLYRWKPRTDKFEKVNESIRVMEDLNLHTGMTSTDIQRDLKQKEIVLGWMVKNNIKNVDAVGRIMKIYYKSPQVIINAAMQNMNPYSVIGAAQ